MAQLLPIDALFTPCAPLLDRAMPLSCLLGQISHKQFVISSRPETSRRRSGETVIVYTIRSLTENPTLVSEGDGYPWERLQPNTGTPGMRGGGECAFAFA